MLSETRVTSIGHTRSIKPSVMTNDGYELVKINI